MRSNAIVAAWILAAVLGMPGCNSSHSNERKEVQSGSPTQEPVPAVPSTPEQVDPRPVIVTFGDSLTQGVSGKSYPAFLQDLIDRAGYRYRVDNQGVSGDTTSDGLARVDNVIAAKPVLVVLEFGGNDGLRGVPVTATRQNLDEMIQRLQMSSIPVVLAGITLPPNYGPDYVKPFTAIFPELAKKYKLRSIPFLLVHVYSDRNLMQPDGIHPNQAGNEIVAKDVFDLIRPLLDKGSKAMTGMSK
jgi:acyl-CoA thioesterase-1